MFICSKKWIKGKQKKKNTVGKSVLVTCGEVGLALHRDALTCIFLHSYSCIYLYIMYGSVIKTCGLVGLTLHRVALTCIYVYKYSCIYLYMYGLIVTCGLVGLALDRAAAGTCLPFNNVYLLQETIG